MPLEAGDVLEGRFTIEQAIQEGGMGEVYRALDQQTGESVALKRMLLERFVENAHDDPHEKESAADLIRRKFGDEVKMLRCLDCPGIPRFVAEFQHEGANCIVMEFIEGQDLESLLHETIRLTHHPLPPRRVVDIGIKVCWILEYLHDREPPIIHRDVKPANIIQRKDDQRICLVDFGLARGVVPDKSTTLVGTFGYAPLEQFEGRPEQRSDQYALGATMHQLLTGNKPGLHIEPLSQTHPDIHPDLAEVIEKATATEFEERYGSIKDFRLTLASLDLNESGTLKRAASAPTVVEDGTAPTQPDLPVKKFAATSIENTSWKTNRHSWVQKPTDLTEDLEDDEHQTPLWRTLPIQTLMVALTLLLFQTGCQQFAHHRRLARIAPLVERGELSPKDVLSASWKGDWLELVSTSPEQRAGVIFRAKERGGSVLRFEVKDISPESSVAVVFWRGAGVLIQDRPAQNQLQVQLVQVEVPSEMARRLINFVAYRRVGQVATVELREGDRFELTLPESDDGKVRLNLDPAAGVKRELLNHSLGRRDDTPFAGAVLPLPSGDRQVFKIRSLEVGR